MPISRIMIFLLTMVPALTSAALAEDTDEELAKKFWLF